MKHTKQKEKPLIVLTAGGTGGHIYPAESLADELLQRGYRLTLITDSRGKDNYKGRLGEIPQLAVYAGALVGKSRWFKIKSLFKTGIGVLQAAWFLIKKRPVCVVGFGGYASFPACMAAILLGKGLVIHEQNAVMSRTNRFLSKYAELTAQSFKNVKFAPKRGKSILTGMPVRKSIVAVGAGDYPTRTKQQKFRLLVLGGSQGAKVFGEIIPAAVCSLSEENQNKLQIFQQCREADIPEVIAAYENSKAEVVIAHFFNNMDELYARTHLIISRAGASSVSEIEVVGLPSILVPLPVAADDHQTHNAAEIANVQAGIVLKQKDFTLEKTAQILEEAINDPKSLNKMSQNAKSIAIRDAAERLADAIEKEIIIKW